MEGIFLLLTTDEEQKKKLTEQYGDNGNLFTHLKNLLGRDRHTESIRETAECIRGMPGNTFQVNS